MKAYVVTISVPGYLPEGDPIAFSNRRDAETYAADEARRVLEQSADEQTGALAYHKSGSARTGSIALQGKRGADARPYALVLEIHELAGEEAADALAWQD